jgi:glycosyltransferase involved in cell wall biosynthesis
MEKLVIVPTYNERENIDPLLDRLLGLPFGLDVLVVDDGSPDGTADQVKQWQAKTPRVHLIQRPGKMGLGSAYRDGFRYALANGAEYVFEMDADFSHDPTAIGDFLEAVKDADIVLRPGASNVSAGARSRASAWTACAPRATGSRSRCRSAPGSAGSGSRRSRSCSWTAAPASRR